MGIVHVSKRYSRGNDDQTENQYETAQIEVTLTLNTNDCEVVDGRCKGTVVPLLSYRATSSTDEAMFAGGAALQLRDTGAAGASVNLAFTPGPVPFGPGITPPPSPRGSTLAAKIDLAVLGCRGGRRTGTAQIEMPGGRVYEIVDYDYEVTECGVIATQTVSVSERPAGAAGAVPTPLRDITPPPPGAPAGPTGYPAYPGTPRTP
jgi:hypothetical protein